MKSILQLVNYLEIPISLSLSSNNKSILTSSIGFLKPKTIYTISIGDGLKGANQSIFSPKNSKFKTNAGDLKIISLTFEDSEQTKTGLTVNVPLDF